MNGMHADSKLQIGETIKIPSAKSASAAVNNKTNISQKQLTTAIPRTTTHVVTKGETLYGIGKKYGVTVQQIKTWNHLTSDYAQEGETLVIGADAATVAKVAATSVQPETIQEQTQVNTQKQRVETASQDVQKNADAEKVTTTIDPNTTPQNNSYASTMAAPLNAEAEANANKAAAEEAIASTYSGDGYFMGQFKKDGSAKTVTGVSKTFKTASGWSDGKFYILANDIEPGTIVKLTAENGKSVYAKVLWNLGDLKDNAGISFRISNATAAALKENADSFNLNVAF
jgi:murein DD-endopeptidase MepM/ murein hydrolase activator NlpD